MEQPTTHIAQAVERKTEMETSDTHFATQVLDLPRIVNDLTKRIEALEGRHDVAQQEYGPSPESIDVVARWAPRHGHDDDADVTRTIAEICDTGDGDIRIDVGDTTIWIPRWQLNGALNALHIWRD